MVNLRDTFRAKLYIGIGETGAFYTLRQTYLHETYIPGPGPAGNAIVNGVYQGTVEREVRSFHHFNLSQDIDEAIAKAKNASLKLGVPFKGTRESVEADLRDIKRRTAEEIEIARNSAEEERRLEEERRHKEWVERERNNIRVFEEDGHYVQAGKYSTVHVTMLPKSYCGWLVDNIDEFDPESFMFYLAKTVRDHYSDQVPRKVEIDPDKYFGEPGQRLDFHDLLVVGSFYYDSMYGRVYITKMVDSDGVCFVIKSGAFSAAEGDDVSIKATIKCHDEYNGQAQTVLQRAKYI